MWRVGVIPNRGPYSSDSGATRVKVVRLTQRREDALQIRLRNETVAILVYHRERLLKLLYLARLEQREDTTWLPTRPTGPHRL